MDERAVQVFEVAPGPPAHGIDAAALTRLADHFTRYVDEGRLPGVALAVARRGAPLLEFADGWRDLARGLPIAPDTIVRAYSMTKPVTAATLLSFYDEGRFALDDPVADYLPEFAELAVVTGGDSGRVLTRPAATCLEVRHLLAHTAGFASGFEKGLADECYRRERLQVPQEWGGDLAAYVGRVAALPLAFDPGTDWRYGAGLEVAARLAEVLGGRPFSDLVRERILEPLAMRDSGFAVPPGALARFAVNYRYDAADGFVAIDEPETSGFTRPPLLASGGAGLLTTLADYRRFAVALAGDGGGILAPETAALARANHLPGGVDLATLGHLEFHGTDAHGIGYGLGGAVVVGDHRRPGRPCPGSYFWGGVASTDFLADPASGFAAVLVTQLTPSWTWPLRPELWSLLYATLEG